MAEEIAVGANVVSVAGTIIQAVDTVKNWILGSPHPVSCQLDVDNYTKYILERPFYKANYGSIQEPPCTIMPGHNKIMVALQNKDKDGSAGSVSWRIRGMDYRLVVVWSVKAYKQPNFVGVGIAPQSKPDNDWYRQMRDLGLNWFKKVDITDVDGPTVEYRNCEFTVVGTMGSTDKPGLVVSIFPNCEQHAAHNLKHLVFPKSTA